MNDVGDYLEKEINKQVRADTFNILKGVVLATPVDEGRAKGNWQVSQNNPIMTEAGILDRTGSITINAGLTQIAQAKQTEYPVMWITNNLPYIVRLNEGWSDKAPSKYIDTVIKRVNNGR